MAFFAWGALCAADLGQRAKRLRSQALWGLVAALASSVFCAQLCIQVTPSGCAALRCMQLACAAQVNLISCFSQSMLRSVSAGTVR